MHPPPNDIGYRYTAEQEGTKQDKDERVRLGGTELTGWRYVVVQTGDLKQKRHVRSLFWQVIWNRKDSVKEKKMTEKERRKERTIERQKKERKKERKK